MENTNKNRMLGIVAALSFNALISYAYAATPNDPSLNKQYAVNNIELTNAWDITTGSNQVIVAVIDSGIDSTHEDLKNNIWMNPFEIASNGIDDDNNGYIDDISGWNFQDSNNDTSDYMGHGNIVAGVIAAEGNNGFGIAGVSWNAKLMPLRIHQKENPDENQLAAAIRYAVDNGAQIINGSLAGRTYSQKVFDALSYANEKGVLYVGSAGNYGTDNDATPVYPASYELPNVISVAATDENDDLAAFQFGSSSCYGESTVHVAAPGKDIYSTGTLSAISTESTYSTNSGTSLSAPQVSGLAALLLSQDINRKASDLKRIILSTVDEKASLEFKVISRGRINAYKALSYEDGPDTIAPVITLKGDNPQQVIVGSEFIDLGATAIDNRDGDITEDVVITGEVNTNETGTYYVTYNVSDAAGNAAQEVVRTVEVVEKPECVQHTSSLNQHEDEGRAISETTGWWWAQTTTWYAVGSEDELGSNGDEEEPLKEQPSGYFTKGYCENIDQPPVVTVQEHSIENATLKVSALVTDINNDVKATYIFIPELNSTHLCEGTYEVVCKADISELYDLKYEAEIYAVDEAGQQSESVWIEFNNGPASCITATNYEHINEDRAYKGGFFDMYAYAKGSDDSLGFVGSSYYSTKTSLARLAGSWVKVNSCD